MRLIDLRWKRFWRLTVLERAEKRWGRTAWKCRCDCGNYIDVISCNLWKSNKSCGCLRKEIASETKTTHWMTHTRILKIFNGILQRCNNPRCEWYKYYGWRWIRCLWDTFEEFHKDMASTYSEELTIERNDNNWNYCKENCCRKTQADQKRNTSKTIKYKWTSLRNYCLENGYVYRTVFGRIKRWLNIEEAMSHDKYLHIK